MRKKRNKGGRPTAARIRVLACSSGSEREIRAGLLAWLKLEIDGTLILDGITLRRTVDGRTTVSFPRRKDPRGNGHALVQPVDAQARRRLEIAILEQLDLMNDGQVEP